MLIKDKLLSSILIKSYVFTWISLSSLFVSVFVNYLVKYFPFSFILSFILLSLIEKTLGFYIRGFLIRLSETSKNPLDKRLYIFFNGWSSFLTAIVLLLILNVIFKLNPPLNPGVFIYFPIVSAVIFFFILFYGILSKRI